MNTSDKNYRDSPLSRASLGSADSFEMKDGISISTLRSTIIEFLLWKNRSETTICMRTNSMVEKTHTSEAVFQLTAAPYVTVKVAAVITGLTEKAIRKKIESGKWIEGKEFRRSPDHGIFISIKGFQQWVEGDRESKLGRAVSGFNLCSKEEHSKSE